MIVENHIKQLNTQTNPKLKGFTRKQYNNQPKATTNPIKNTTIVDTRARLSDTLVEM